MPSIALPVSLRGQLLSGTRTSPAFSPLSLFAASEPGVWLDPSDLTTMFTDTAGTTPVTTPGQTVALMLDKSRGLALGTELVTNGTFDANVTGWDSSSGILSWASGRARVSYSTANPFMRSSVSCVVGKTYFLTGQYFGGSETTRLYVGDSNTGANAQGIVDFSGNGSAQVRFVATATTMWIIASGRSLATGEFVEFDNISVRELPGFHATQATTASRPTYGIVPLGGRRNLLLATDTMATQSLTVAAVAHTLAFTGTGTVTLTGASIAGPLIGTGASNRVSLTFTPTAASLTLTVVGSVTLAQLELGSTATAYQRVTTQYDVTEAGVQSLSYLSFDGVDDHMTTAVDTNTIFGVSGTDPGYLLVGGVRYNTAGGGASVFARAAFCGDSAGYLGMWAHTVNGGEAGLFQWDTAAKTSERPYTVGSTAVFTGRRDPSVSAAGRIYASVNGTSSAGTDAAALSAVSGTFQVGRQFGSTFINGQIYSLIARGALTNATAITNTETWVAGKTGVTL